MEKRNIGIMNRRTLSIVQTSLMIAIIALVTMTVKIPTYTGYTHLGDSMIFLSVILLGKKKSIVASAAGMCLADMLSGYLVWAPFTLVIKGIMALVAALIVYRGNNKGDNVPNNILAFVVAGIWMVVGYLFAGAFVATYTLTEHLSLMQGLILSLKDVPANIVEVLVGIIIAVPMSKMIKKSKYKF
ncbi:MAG: ECF transporter S component [Solirubrobacterales bacterium]